MSVKKRKKHYRIKPLPVLVTALLLVIVVALLVHLVTSGGEDPADGSSLPASSALSEPTSEPSSEVASEPSSAPESSEITVGGEPESSDSPSSQDAPASSAPPAQNTADIPDPPVNNGDGTISYDGKVYVIAGLPEGSTADWNLILLNPEDGNKIDEEIAFSHAEFDGQVCDARAADAFQSMKDAALAEANVTLFLRSGYRSIATQSVNYNAAIQRYKDQGYSDAEALSRTNAYYTVPGHSEHHSGLAFDTITPEYHRDIWSLDDRFADTDAYVWLEEHCWEYGFILRYAKDKQEITRINFEPWHYRYVGVEHAQFMRENNLCLEEYIALLNAAGR